MAAQTTTAAPSRPEGRPEGLRRAEKAENFPVAVRVLPARYRRHLLAVYDVLRVIDDLGDEAVGDRTQLLLAFQRDLADVWAPAGPVEPVLRRLVPTVSALGIGPEPFEALIAANMQDQHTTRYATFHDLVGYCRLSADPVGRLVLAVFGATSVPGAADERLLPLSDKICMALQLIEHWQDVGEDRRAGRIYLPTEDLEAFGVRPQELDEPTASPALRRLLDFETRRAEQLLDEGAPLVGLLHGWARCAVAGYVAGGRAAARALRRSGFDVLPTGPRGRRTDVLRNTVRLLVRAAR
jgi:squalene synthase HpnC